ncbi:MAG: UDP-N-acetylmuramoyl-tripeptide--D-alanyl-D-alanine ligase [Acidobacteriia bacterium]|nr:UDP-N-acetylmuramoyl-tripeptide--D-alanyl-D-alanine ligase [Terriglobia bacterium]
MTAIALPLGAKWVAAVMAGEIVHGDAAREFSAVSIDTRTLAPGELYIGIRGERFDGAEFAPAAIAAGAAGVVVPRGRGAGSRSASLSGERDAVVIEVDDTTLALQALARAVRRASGTKVVAITGSAGKTTTKEITAEFLSARYRVIRNRGNFNNHIGLPLSLIELRQRPEIAVVELGMNHAGEISTLIGVAEPDVRVWTNVGDAHLGFFASVDALADAKAEILDSAAASTTLVANADDDRVMARVASFPGRTVTFGIDREASVRASAIVDRGIDGIAARVTTARGAVNVSTPLVGRGNLANILAATAVATEFDVPLDAMAARAATLRAARHRGEVVRLASGVTVLDDSYNASPAATLRALDVFARSRAVRRIAVLGEMLELGAHAGARHQDVGRAAAQARIDVLFAVGGDAARALADAAIAAGMARASVRHFATSDEAAEAAAALVTRGDLVLVKGSRGVKTDRVVERLTAGRG